MKNIKIIGIQSLVTLPYEQQLSLAKAYQSIYGYEPWNEQWKCGNINCDKFWGINQKKELEQLEFRHCGLPIQPYWPEQERLETFKELSMEEKFCASIAFDRSNIIGFCWAYQFKSNEEIDQKMGMNGLGQIISSLEGPTAYLADLAVEPEYRGRGIAKLLTKARSELMFHVGIANIFTRTKSGSNPSITDLWYKKIGFPIIASYNDKRERVIRAAKLQDIYW